MTEAEKELCPVAALLIELNKLVAEACVEEVVPVKSVDERDVVLGVWTWEESDEVSMGSLDSSTSLLNAESPLDSVILNE